MSAKNKLRNNRHRSGRRGRLCDGLRATTAVALLLAFPVAMQAQMAAAAGGSAPQSAGLNAGQSTSQSTNQDTSQDMAQNPVRTAGTGNTPPAGNAPGKKAEKEPTSRARRRAAKLYEAASKLYLNAQFEQALDEYQQAAALDPTNADYHMAADVARSHAATALVQAAAKARIKGDEAGARADLLRADQLDPKNPEIAQHLYELSDEQSTQEAAPLYEEKAAEAGEAVPLLAASGVRSFHLRAEPRQLIQQVFRAYQIEPLMDDSVDSIHHAVRLDLDNVNFAAAARALGLVTNTFYVPLDAQRVLVARDTRENRRQFSREQLETVYLAGLDDQEQTDVESLAKYVFNITETAKNPESNSLTLRGSADNLGAFNTNMRSLLAGHNQVMLDMRVIQVANNRTLNSGVQPPQSISAFNVYSQEQSILNANQSLVQQIISSGLASPGDTLAILGILLASGQVSSSLFSGGIALFGGGLTQSALSPSGPATLNLNLNSSETRVLDDIQLRLGDGEAGTIKEGTKYPIQTSSYSSAASNLPNIPGLTGAGASGSLGSLLSSLAGAMPTIPMIQYQDLGFTLKVTPNVLRSDDVALTVDLSITALAGSTLNGNPILNNEALSGIVTLKAGEAVEVASQLNQSESRAISGTPGLSEIPGLNNITDKNLQKNYSTLLIMITPHVVRSTQDAGRTPPMLVETTPVH